MDQIAFNYYFHVDFEAMATITYNDFLHSSYW